MRNDKHSTNLWGVMAIATIVAAMVAGLGAQATQTKPQTPATPGAGTKPATSSAPAPLVVPADYVIGPSDVLTIGIWRDKDLSSDVVVRPDGKITLQLVNDVQAAGMTPMALAASLTKALAPFKEDPNVTVIVKAINSRMVYITGQVAHSGAYPLTDHMTVATLITIAGGVADFADKENITLIRTENGVQTSYRINFKDIVKRKNLKQNNLELKSGDQIIVP